MQTVDINPSAADRQDRMRAALSAQVPGQDERSKDEKLLWK